jgi:hypothetical protein
MPITFAQSGKKTTPGMRYMPASADSVDSRRKYFPLEYLLLGSDEWSSQKAGPR